MEKRKKNIDPYEPIQKKKKYSNNKKYSNTKNNLNNKKTSSNQKKVNNQKVLNNPKISNNQKTSNNQKYSNKKTTDKSTTINKNNSQSKNTIKSTYTEPKKTTANSRVLRRKRKKMYNILLISIILIGFGLLIYSGINILNWKKDSDNIDKLTEELNNIVKIKDVTNEENEVLVNENEEKVDEFNPYWDYIKMKLIDVDLSDLKKINSETVAWLQLNGTNINYPVVQANNNEFYLTHSFDKKKNNAGWVFMDYRNNKAEFDQNTIIYAHGRINQVMFGTLRNIVKSNWYNNSDNYIVKVSTDTYNTLWQVFSVYHIKTTTDYLKINFRSNDEFQSFIDLIKNRSVYNFNTNVTTNDKIITLSTCYNESEKVVLHAKLIKYSKK